MDHIDLSFINHDYQWQLLAGLVMQIGIPIGANLFRLIKIISTEFW